MSLHGFIFDLDGTLADSLGDIAAATNQVLKAHGLRELAVDQYRTLVGEGAEVLMRRAFHTALGQPDAPSSPLPRALPELVEAYRVAYDAVGHTHSTAYDGVVELLSQLTKRRIPFAVLSNKRDDFTRALVQRLFGQFPFADVRGERDGVPRKPDPTAAFELSLALNVPPAGIGFVGDTAIDMRTAVAARMTGVGVQWGFRPHELVPNGAKHLISRPEALLELC